MYFVYQKYVNIDSENNYDINAIYNWLVNNLDIEGFINDYKESANPEEFLNEVFTYPDMWMTSFTKDLYIEQEVLDNIDLQDMADQIQEVLYNKLLKYYTDNWQEFAKYIILMNKLLIVSNIYE